MILFIILGLVKIAVTIIGAVAVVLLLAPLWDRFGAPNRERLSQSPIRALFTILGWIVFAIFILALAYILGGGPPLQ